jgi:isoleucyl-tRNA synthetase
VHLTDWPNANELPADAALVTAMDRVRQVASSALSLRKANKLRVRLPLARLLVAAGDAESLRQFTDIIRDEVNVRSVELTTDVAAHGEFEVVVNARAAGPRLGKDVQRVIKAVKAGDWTTSEGGALIAAGIELVDGEYERRLVAKNSGAAAELPGGSGLVLLDTEVSAELAAEGLARDLVRVVQQARREAGLDVADRIDLTVDAPAEVVAAAQPHEQFVAAETLAVSVSYDAVTDGFTGAVGDGIKVTVRVVKA